MNRQEELVAIIKQLSSNFKTFVDSGLFHPFCDVKTIDILQEHLKTLKGYRIEHLEEVEKNIKNKKENE